MIQLLLVIIPLIAKCFKNKRNNMSVRKFLFTTSKKKEIGDLLIFCSISVIIYFYHINSILGEVRYLHYILIGLFIFIIIFVELDLATKKRVFKTNPILIKILFLLMCLLIVFSFSFMSLNYKYSEGYNRVPVKLKELVVYIVPFFYLILSTFYYRLAVNTVTKVMQPNVRIIGLYKYKNRLRKIISDDVLIDRDKFIFINYSSGIDKRIEKSVVIIKENLVKIESFAKSNFENNG